MDCSIEQYPPDDGPPTIYWCALKTRMKYGVRIAFIIALCLNALATPGFAENSPVSFKGQWHLDLKQSFTPWGPIPKSVTLNVMTDDGKIYEAQETWVRADGAVTTEVIHAPIDGKFYPVLGSPSNTKVAITNWVPGFFRMELLAPNGLRGVETCKISIDSKITTCDEIDTDLKGKNTSSRSVYIRS